MLWSLVKILFFIGIAAALTYGAGYLLEAEGGVRFQFNGQERSLTPLGFLIALVVLMVAVWIILKLAGLCVAIVRTFLGDNTALARYFDRNRERKGYDALAQSMMALASGDARKAQTKAQKAEKYLNRPEITGLLTAQAAEANGDKARAGEIYKAMLSNDKARFVGIKGLLKHQLDTGNTDTALKLAEKAFALNPKNGEVTDTLFGLQSKSSDWAGARTTLAAKVRQSALPREVGKRREAVLLVADAFAAQQNENGAAARDAAYHANRIAPDFVPAASLAATLHTEAGEQRKSTKLLKKAWTTAPHPDLAAAFAAIAPDETADARLTRFQALIATNPNHPESKMVGAELALAAEDFPAARRALGDLAEEDPTTRSLAIMAAIEKGEGAPDTVVRGWLAKALSVPRSETWICSNCNAVHGAWAPICDSCEAFDTFTWTRPSEKGQTDSTAAAMLPLIIGALEDGTAKPEPANQEAPIHAVQDPEPIEPEDAKTVDIEATPTDTPEEPTEKAKAS